jgi:hypothetical protein
MATIAEHLGLESAYEAARRERSGAPSESKVQRALRHAGVREVQVVRLPPAEQRLELWEVAAAERRRRGART